jgi:hypothetical protein
MWLLSNQSNKFLFELKENEVYPAKIETLIAGNEAIVNFKGNFVRVKNNSDLKAGDNVKLRLVQMEPKLIFEIVHKPRRVNHQKSRFVVSG